MWCKTGRSSDPILFHLCIDDLVKNLNSFPSGAISINGLLINSLLYADDIVLLANSKEALQTFLDIFIYLMISVHSRCYISIRINPKW